MTLLIASSNEDPASRNIKNALIKQSKWDKIETMFNNPVFRKHENKEIILVTINDRTIRHENLDEEVEEKLGVKIKQVIFVSRHRGGSGIPTLTAHPIGNFGEAEYGGRTRKLCESAPRLMTHLLRKMRENAEKAKLNYTTCYEVTHHGPFISKPTIFVEIGSTEKEWIQKKPAEIVAKTILDTTSQALYEEDLPSDSPVIIGIGGGHYAPRFTKVVFEKKVAFGHMIPKYQIDNGNINPAMLQETVQKTPNVEGVYFDKKSLRKSLMKEYKKWFENNNIPVLSSKNLVDL